MKLRGALAVAETASSFVLVGAGLLIRSVRALAAVGTVALSGMLRGLLYQIPPADPATLAGTGLVLGAVATLACLGPALRAAAVDPAVVLRQE